MLQEGISLSGNPHLHLSGSRVVEGEKMRQEALHEIIILALFDE